MRLWSAGGGVPPLQRRLEAAADDSAAPSAEPPALATAVWPPHGGDRLGGGMAHLFGELSYSSYSHEVGHFGLSHVHAHFQYNYTNTCESLGQ